MKDPINAWFAEKFDEILAETLPILPISDSEVLGTLKPHIKQGKNVLRMKIKKTDKDYLAIKEWLENE